MLGKKSMGVLESTDLQVAHHQVTDRNVIVPFHEQEFFKMDNRLFVAAEAPEGSVLIWV